MTNATRPLYRRDVAPHGVGIVCIDEARVINAPGDNSSNHHGGIKYREIPARTGT